MYNSNDGWLHFLYRCNNFKQRARTSKALSSTSAWELVDDKGLVGIAEEIKIFHKNIRFSPAEILAIFGGP